MEFKKINKNKIKVYDELGIVLISPKEKPFLKLKKMCVAVISKDYENKWVLSTDNSIRLESLKEIIEYLNTLK